MPEVPSANWSTFAALLVFIAGSVWLGTLAQRAVERGSFVKGYFLGNRGLGAWALALTATVQSGGTFMGFPSFVYSYGWIVALWIASYMVVPITGFGVFGKRLAQLSRRTGAITVPDMLRYRFDSHAAGLMASLLILFFMSAMMVAQFKAGALVMKIAWPGSGALALTETTPEDVKEPQQAATEGDVAATEEEPPAAPTPVDTYYNWGIVIFAITVVGYTLIGGFLAAVWTDLFQSVMMLIGVMILLPLALSQAGGLDAATRKLQTELHWSTLNNPKLEAAEAPARQALRALDASLRERLAVGDLLPAEATPLPGHEAIAFDYFGAGKPLRQAATQDAPASTGRDLVALTVGDAKQPRTALYSNGLVRSAIYSNPGDLVTGPGPDDWHPLGMAISMFGLWIFSGLGSAAGMVRIMACKDTATIRRSIFLLSVYNLFIYLPLIAICICARSIMPDLGKLHSDEVIPRMALEGTSSLWGGGFIAGLILAAPFGAVMATVSSYLVVIASGIVHDIYQRFINPQAPERTVKLLTFWCMVAVGVLAAYLAYRKPAYLQSIVVFSGTCGASTFVVPAIMTAYWRRANAAGVMAAMGAGVLSVLALYIYGTANNQWEFKGHRLAGMDPVLWGIVASVAAGVAATYLAPAPPRELVAKMFDVEQG